MGMKAKTDRVRVALEDANQLAAAFTEAHDGIEFAARFVKDSGYNLYCRRWGLLSSCHTSRGLARECERLLKVVKLDNADFRRAFSVSSTGANPPPGLFAAAPPPPSADERADSARATDSPPLEVAPERALWTGLLSTPTESFHTIVSAALVGASGADFQARVERILGRQLGTGRAEVTVAAVRLASFGATWWERTGGAEVDARPAVAAGVGVSFALSELTDLPELDIEAVSYLVGPWYYSAMTEADEMNAISVVAETWPGLSLESLIPHKLAVEDLFFDLIEKGMEQSLACMRRMAEDDGLNH